MDTKGDPEITLDDEGICNYCKEAKVLLDRLSPDEERMERCFSEIKKVCKHDSYNRLVGVSGGLDSSYIIYLGHKYGFRMLGVHIDDGLDTDLAKNNIRNLCEKAKVILINIKPDVEQYRDLTLSFLKASVPNLAIPQDNLILAGLTDAAKKYHLKYMLHAGIT